jgi:hypothetical protein
VSFILTDPIKPILLIVVILRLNLAEEPFMTIDIMLIDVMASVVAFDFLIALEIKTSADHLFGGCY